MFLRIFSALNPCQLGWLCASMIIGFSFFSLTPLFAPLIVGDACAYEKRKRTSLSPIRGGGYIASKTARSCRTPFSINAGDPQCSMLTLPAYPVCAEHGEQLGVCHLVAANGVEFFVQIGLDVQVRDPSLSCAYPSGTARSPQPMPLFTSQQKLNPGVLPSASGHHPRFCTSAGNGRALVFQ